MKQLLLMVLTGVVVLSGCTPKVETKNEIEIKPIEIKPMSISIDVNLNVKVDRELDDFFGTLDAQEEEL